MVYHYRFGIQSHTSAIVTSMTLRFSTPIRRYIWVFDPIDLEGSAQVQIDTSPPFVLPTNSALDIYMLPEFIDKGNAVWTRFSFRRLCYDVRD